MLSPQRKLARAYPCCAVLSSATLRTINLAATSPPRLLLAVQSMVFCCFLICFCDFRFVPPFVFFHSGPITSFFSHTIERPNLDSLLSFLTLGPSSYL